LARPGNPLDHIAARHKALKLLITVGLRPVVNFINIKRVNFTYESLFSNYILALNELSYEKRARKTFMK